MTCCKRLNKWNYHYHVHLVDNWPRVGCSTFCCATPCWREPTSSKQPSTVAVFCRFSVWSLYVAVTIMQYRPCTDWVTHKFFVGTNETVRNIRVSVERSFIVLLSWNVMQEKTCSLTAEFPSKSTRTVALKFSPIWYTGYSIEALDIVQYTAVDFCFCWLNKRY